MEELLKNISQKDLEKLRVLLSIIPGNEPKEIVTLRVLRDEYLNLIMNNKSKSYCISVNLAFKHMTAFFGAQLPIHNLQQKEIENFINHLQQKVKTVSHSRLNFTIESKQAASRGGNGYVVYYRNLKAAFNKAKEWGYVKENYFTKVKLPKRQKLAPAFIDSMQLSEISKQIKNKTVKDVVVFAFNTGMRLDEIVNLRWKNVDLENRIITVGDENFITKGRKQRFIPICEEAYAILTAKVTPSSILPLGKGEKVVGRSLGFARDFVFCKKNGEKFTGNYFSKQFKKACKAAGLDDAIHFHSLRHSFASNLVQKDVPLYTIKELLGHSSISTTEIYSHLNMATLREAVKKLDGPPLSFGHLPLSKGESYTLKIFRINSAEEG